MKILYFIPALYNSGGMERVISSKINYLNEKYGYKIIVVTTEQMGQKNFFQLNADIIQYNLDIDFNKHFHTHLFKKYFLHKKKLKRYKKAVVQIIDTEQPDICLSTLNKETEFICKLKDKSKKILEIAFSKNIREQFLVSRKTNIVWKYLGKFRTFQLIQSAKKFDKLVVLTKADEIDWKKTNTNIVQIYNPNQLETVEKSDCKNKKAIAVGRLDAQKGFDLLITAWKNVAEKHPDWILEIWGEGELHEKLARQIVDNGLENFVFLRGATKNIIKAYIDSSLLVMSSRYEGLGMVLIEAMACGLPCVSFDCQCGPNEIITDGINGFLIPAGDCEYLSNKINLLISNESLRQTMSISAKKTSENYNMNKIMEQWNKLFLDLINNIK